MPLPSAAAAFTGSARIDFIRSVIVREICCTAFGSVTMMAWNSDTGMSSTAQRGRTTDKAAKQKELSARARVEQALSSSGYLTGPN